MLYVGRPTRGPRSSTRSPRLILIRLRSSTRSPFHRPLLCTRTSPPPAPPAASTRSLPHSLHPLSHTQSLLRHSSAHFPAGSPGCPQDGDTARRAHELDARPPPVLPSSLRLSPSTNLHAPPLSLQPGSRTPPETRMTAAAPTR
jgi:hypothetical protein